METFLIHFVSSVLYVPTFVPMNDKEQQILRQAREVFMRFGLRSVTMDDVCREIGISKKTLYLYVTDKGDLIQKILKLDIQDDEAITCTAENNHLQAIDELLAIQDMVQRKINAIHSSILYDLKKYYPEAWAMMHSHRERFVVNAIEQNILRGQQQGLYRTDLNPSVIARIYAHRLEIVFDPSLFEGLAMQPSEIYAEAMRYHIRGIATNKGIQYLEKTLSNPSQ